MTDTPESSSAGQRGWFSYEPVGDFDPSDEMAVTNVRLTESDHTGPFWSREGHLSDDYAELQQWLGISQELYADCIRWNDGSRDIREKVRLLKRLRNEVHPNIAVVDP